MPKKLRIKFQNGLLRNEFYSSTRLTFSILFVKGSNVKGVGSVNFASRRDKRWRILLLIHNVPIYAYEEGMLFKFVCTVASTPKSLVNVSLQKKEINHLFTFYG